MTLMSCSILTTPPGPYFCAPFQKPSKHPADIRAIREVTGLDEAVLAPWLERMGLGTLWEELKAQG
jgi:hypothetical protein